MTTANVTFDIKPRTAPDVARADRRAPPRRHHDRGTRAACSAARPRGDHPAVFIAIFFFIVNIGTLENLTQNNIQGFDYTAFEMATAVLLGVTGVSRAQALVIDVQNGYFDRLLLTPVRRSAILIGHMVADVAVSAMLCVPIIGLAFALGIDFQAGVLGVLMFIAHRLAVEPVVRRLRLRHRAEDGQPGGGELELPPVLPVPVPHLLVRAADQLSGWLDTVAGWNPVTYMLEGLRSLALSGWHWDDLGRAALGAARGVPHQLRAVLRGVAVPGEPTLRLASRRVLAGQEPRAPGRVEVDDGRRARGTCLRLRRARHRALPLRHRRLLVGHALRSRRCRGTVRCRPRRWRSLRCPWRRRASPARCSWAPTWRRCSRARFTSAASLNTTPRSTMPERSTTLSVAPVALRLVWCILEADARSEHNSRLAVVGDAVLRNDVLLPARDHHADAERRVVGGLAPACRTGVAVVADRVSRDRGLALR